jgi:hypothetical protein
MDFLRVRSLHAGDVIALLVDRQAETAPQAAR